MFQVNSSMGSLLRRRPRWCVLTAILFVVLASSLRAQQNPAAREPSALQRALVMEAVMVEAIAKAEKSVVAIARGRRGDQADRLGDPDFIPNEFATGVVIDRRGLILTNYHVLGDTKQSEYAVWIDRRPYYPARIKAADPWSDLAVLEIEADNLRPMEFGDAEQLKKGQLIIALGNPYAIARDGSVSATWGIISNLSRKAAPVSSESNPGGKETLHHFGTLIQTDARLNRGTSGGALVNLRGKMIGLTTSLAALPGFERSAGFAIPLDAAMRRVIEQLKQGKEVEYGFLGVRSHAAGAARARAGPDWRAPRANRARHAGRQLRFCVWTTSSTHIDGEPVYDNDSLFLHVGSAPVDHVARLTVRRYDPFLRRSPPCTARRQALQEARVHLSSGDRHVTATGLARPAR